MIYELRVYRVVQGRMAALLTRFEEFEKCVVGFEVAERRSGRSRMKNGDLSTL
jgi:hypothetical protein